MLPLKIFQGMRQSPHGEKHLGGHIVGKEGLRHITDLLTTLPQLFSHGMQDSPVFLHTTGRKTGCTLYHDDLLHTCSAKKCSAALRSEG